MRLPDCIASLLISPLLTLYARSSLKNPPAVEARLRSLLRAYPFWGYGHQRLGEAALSSGDVATAYASAQAAKILFHKKPRLRAVSLHLLGRCFLARGEWQEALKWFQEAQVYLPADFRLKQDQAAALMLAGDGGAALQILSAIPDKQLSVDGRAALEYLLTVRGNDRHTLCPQ